MFRIILSAMPDWMVALVIAGGLWFGFNYTWLSPSYFQKVSSGECGGSAYYRRENDRIGMALYTSTLGIFGSERAFVAQICRD